MSIRSSAAVFPRRSHTSILHRENGVIMQHKPENYDKVRRTPISVKSVLPNGLTVITEVMSNVRSISVGVWIKTGSRRESPEINGITHFIEHMLFKGTTSRSAEDIAREVDSIGGHLDAFTAKERMRLLQHQGSRRASAESHGHSSAISCCVRASTAPIY